MTNQEKGRPIEILLVEDNLGDVVLAREALASAKISNNITVAKDGEQAMDYLMKRNEYNDVLTPDLVLLDLNLPKKDGRQVLSEIKADENLKRLPVVVLTSSEAEHDVVKTYDLHANSYIVKPVDLDKLINIVNAIENFSFTIVVFSEDHK